MWIRRRFTQVEAVLTAGVTFLSKQADSEDIWDAPAMDASIPNPYLPVSGVLRRTAAVSLSRRGQERVVLSTPATTIPVVNLRSGTLLSILSVRDAVIHFSKSGRREHSAPDAGRRSPTEH